MPDRPIDLGLRAEGPGLMAEGVGFEPTVGRTHNGFRDRPIRPLSHPSRPGQKHFLLLTYVLWSRSGSRIRKETDVGGSRESVLVARGTKTEIRTGVWRLRAL